MKYQWINKNIDRNSLVESVELFLKSKKFEICREDSNESCKIVGIFRTPEHEMRSVIVRVSGTPNKFTIDLLVGDQTLFVLKFSSLISLIGGGLLLVKKQKTADFYKRFEDEFWDYLESKVDAG